MDAGRGHAHIPEHIPEPTGRTGRRPYRVIFEESRADGTSRRGTIIAAHLETARLEARAIARNGMRAEVHYVGEDGEHRRLEEHTP